MSSLTVSTTGVKDSDITRHEFGSSDATEILITIPNHFAVRPSRYGFLGPDSPHEGLYTGYNADSGTVIALLHCVQTRRSVVASYIDGVVLGSALDAVWEQPFQYLRDGRPENEITISFHTFKTPFSLSYAPSDPVKDKIVTEVTRLGFKLEKEVTIPLADSLGMTFARGKAAVQLHILPPTLQGEGYEVSHHCNSDNWNDDRFTTEAMLSTVTATLKANLVAARVTLPPLSLCYDGSKAVCELRLDDNSRQLVLAARSGASSKELTLLLGKITGRPTPHASDNPSGVVIRLITHLGGRQPWCETCCRDARLKCSGCGGASYCSPEHQKEDWKHHKNW